MTLVNCGVLASFPHIPFLSHVDQRYSGWSFQRNLSLPAFPTSDDPASLLQQISTLTKILVLTGAWGSKLDQSPDLLNLRGLWSFSPAKCRCTPPVLMLSSITISTTSAIISTSYRSGAAFTGVQWSWPQTEKLCSKATWSVTKPVNLLLSP